MSSEQIEILLEKYLTSIKMYGHIVDSYENPSMKEFALMGSKFRFILDAQRRSAYIWDAGLAIHADMWKGIKKDLGDDRNLYRSGDLLTGVVEGKAVVLDALRSMSDLQRKSLKGQDWSFAEKYIDLKKLQTELNRG